MVGPSDQRGVEHTLARSLTYSGTYLGCGGKKDNNLKLSKDIFKYGGRKNKDMTPKEMNNPKQGASRANKYIKNNKSDPYAWKKLPQASREKHSGKSVGDKSYNWCLDHMA